MSNPKPGLLEQLKSFRGVYWTGNWIELVERFAYYGVRVVLPVFMVLAIAKGGPEFTHVQKGSIYASWALVQSFVPIFSGGFADRYGYRLNIALSTVFKILGYLVMGFTIYIAESLAGKPLAEARAEGTDLAYELFYAGAMLLAFGTAIFKPAIQGLLVHQLDEKKNAAFGWAIFYQVVNIGGFIGPMIAGYLRILDWTYVFLACAGAIALNFLPLPFFRDPEKKQDVRTPVELVKDAITGLLEPRLLFFTLAFSGFWLMFYQLFDILPNFIDDWIDSRGAASALKGLLGDWVPTVHGGNLVQSWMINFNAFLISLFAFGVGFLTGKIRALAAIITGIGISAVGILGLGASMSGYWVLLCIAVFSLGEMTASPTKHRYLASIAPEGKEGLYMGYLNMTVGIGWSLGSLLAGKLYDEGGDKVVLARRYLIEELGQNPSVIGGLSKQDVLPKLQELAQVDAWGVRDLLWNAYEPGSMWLIFTLIGVGSLILISIYNHLVKAADNDSSHPFNTKGRTFVRVALVPVVAAMIVGCVLQFSGALLFMALMFAVLLVVAFVSTDPNPSA